MMQKGFKYRVNNPNPVLFFEHKQLYRSVYQDVPKITKKILKLISETEGTDVTIISFELEFIGLLETFS